MEPLSSFLSALHLTADKPPALPSLDLRDAYVLVVAVALIVRAIYKKYEVQPSSYLPTLALLVLIPYLCSTFLNPHFTSSFTAYLTGFSVFYTSVLTSIALYRLSPWHPLAKYPGPIGAKLSKFWLIWIIWRGKQLEVVRDLHKKYGPYVRTGPNEVSFADVDLLPALLAPDMPRGPMWDGRRNPDASPSVLSCRTSAEHARKRVPWMHGLNTANVRDYQPMIVRRAVQLAEELEKRWLAGTAGEVNLVEYMKYFAFDVMGDVAFGDGFQLLRDGDKNGLWKNLSDRLDNMAWQAHIPWATRLLLKLPFATDAIVKFRDFTITCATKRKARGANVKDLFYHLNNEDTEDPNVSTDASFSNVVANGEVAIVAGSDTTSTTLSGIFYYLLSNPQYYQRLQAEVDEAFSLGEVESFDGSKLAEMRFLNAVINETLRFQPAVPTAIQRAPEKGTGGKWVGEHFFSENTAVNVPPYVLHRDPRYFFPLTDTFWPDRWLPASLAQPHPTLASEKSPFTANYTGPIITNTTAFIPFSMGHANCVGKNLALAEIRVVLALLMQKFEMRFAAGYDPVRWEKEMVDYTLLKVGELPVELTLRR